MGLIYQFVFGGMMPNFQGQAEAAQQRYQEDQRRKFEECDLLPASFVFAEQTTRSGQKYRRVPGEAAVSYELVQPETVDEFLGRKRREAEAVFSRACGL